ncbi:vanadium-dependent haloperoxidase [Nonomuraea typhae]|uniref:vanadium-dependent haloperoxidase n=1 Tax=Nonomuraea typhae TaxID=2603600 RepID=UPI0012FCB483|nr:vanadium-dependent haloperoxidase [Nonomuraea typhae]
MSLVSALAATALAANTLTSPVSAPAGNAVALRWYDVTAETVAAAGASTQATNSRTWAISWLAAARALHRPAAGAATRRAGYADAALASAVHTALTALAPSRVTELDAALADTLNAIPDGPGESSGVAAGQREARALLAERQNDGLDPASINAPFPAPAPAPGVWQPTPPAYTPATQSGSRAARPFLLQRADQFRPGPPPELGSPPYEKDLAEVRAYGSQDSTVRTQAQTDTAQFWLGSSLTLYTGVLRAGVEQARRPAELVALFHVALVDTQIATSDAKYAYLRWRPVTALRAGGAPDWTPLHTTPAHPDYPSGHNTYSGAAEGVLTALLGPRARRPYTITSPTQPGASRTYGDWSTPTRENVDARVWSGIHTRTADLAGVRLGKQVGVNAVRNAHRLY